MIQSEKLITIQSLKDNWDGNGAKAFPPQLINKVSDILENLSVQPEVFPTACGTIQLKFENSLNEHMEIEIGESDLAEMFIVKKNGEESSETIEITPNEINNRVETFYNGMIRG